MRIRLLIAVWTVIIIAAVGTASYFLVRQTSSADINLDQFKLEN